MNFQDYCNKAKEIDQQEVNIANTFVIRYENSNKQYFNIDPKDVFMFLEYLRDNYQEFYEQWSKIEKRKDLITKWEEKSYRAIYKYAEKNESLNTVTAAARSQTWALTKIISKLISFLAGKEYVGIEKNTYFDIDSVSLALSNKEKDLLSSRSGFGENNIDQDLKKRFKAWLKVKGLSEGSIYKYAETSVSAADSYVKGKVDEFTGFYFVKNIFSFEKALDFLNQNDEWISRNSTGGQMYSAGINNLYEFMKDYFEERKEKCFLSKPFLLLAGISGTGKSRFVRQQAFAKDFFCSISVRPDWHEPSDLLGYISRLTGKAEYHPTDTLSFIVAAWRNACDFSNTTETVLANIDPSNMETFWLCLDEMNLAPVEQYFADYLSVIESRKWDGDQYSCDPLLKAAAFNCIEDSELQKLRDALKISDSQYDNLWKYFVTVGVPVPPNLIVAGTVNMDETTHGFSRKVIDRALTFDFGKFFPNDFDDYLDPQVQAKNFSFPTLSYATKEDLQIVEADKGGEKTIKFCKELNEHLKNSSFELAFRALNELLISLICINPKDEVALLAVWDDFLMTKVLPRVEGDIDKLSVIGKEKTILELLKQYTETTFSDIKDSRPDFFREKIGGGELTIKCRSIEKLTWMQNRLEQAGFTSFWP